MGDVPILKFYNTLTREKADFKPIDPQNVRMYVCGPTVYDFAHIGNARPVIVFDVLYRLLRHVYGENHVTYVRNITDVDDKINARALRDFPGLPLNEAIRNVTEKTEKQFMDDAAALGCLSPNHQPRATENIVEMIEIIQRLLDRGNAYVTAGAEGREVLFSVPSMPDYGQLSKRKLEDQQAGARIAVEAHKRNPGDFVLWKESAENEPGWHAEFVSDGQKAMIFGRPGWHIECSAMSQRYLGDMFDIHGGGLDLIFPHHENEIAQSRCANDTSVMANVWMHNGFLQVEGRKMSKSEGNFVTIAELLHTEKFGGREWSGRALKLAMLMTHYRQPIDWTVNNMLVATQRLSNYATLLDPNFFDDPDAVNYAWDAPVFPSPIVVSALAEDLNTSDALTLIDGFSKKIGKNDDFGRIRLAHNLRFLGLLEKSILKPHQGSIGAFWDGAVPPETLNRASILAWSLKSALTNNSVKKIDELDQELRLLGFKREADDFGSVEMKYVGEEDNSLSNAINKRLEFLEAKNFAEADKIRNELLAKGIQLIDTKDPETGKRKTIPEFKR